VEALNLVKIKGFYYYIESQSLITTVSTLSFFKYIYELNCFVSPYEGVITMTYRLVMATPGGQ